MDPLQHRGTRVRALGVSLAALALVSCTSGASRAQVAEHANVVAKDEGARMERVAEGVYAIVHDDATDEWPHGNTGVIVTREGVFVVDATYLPSRARADIALIRSVTNQPVRYLAFTHWHFDHNNGTIAYRDAFPGIEIVSERKSAAWIELNGVWWSRMSTAPDSKKRASLAELEKKLAAGHDTSGVALGADERTELARTIARRKNELAELATLQVVRPTRTFDRELAIELGGRRIELRNRGPANSPADVTIYLPAEKVLFAGDIVVQAPLPYVGASWPVTWIGVLQELEATPTSVLVPGHGPVMHDHAYTRQVRELLEAATSRVEAMIRKGMTLEQIQAAIDLDDRRRSCPAWSPAGFADDWKIVTNALVERCWRGVRGQGG
jgi:glyoxylase-like metal-dependent hydrolase (beta-lactamase superfamily II)